MAHLFTCSGSKLIGEIDIKFIMEIDTKAVITTAIETFVLENSRNEIDLV